VQLSVIIRKADINPWRQWSWLASDGDATFNIHVTDIPVVSPVPQWVGGVFHDPTNR
jgi:hypothetical protein